MKAEMRGQLAAMKYLADKYPKKMRIKHFTKSDTHYILLEEYNRTYGSWLVEYKVAMEMKSRTEEKDE
jgi:hypothetical protein